MTDIQSIIDNYEFPIELGILEFEDNEIEIKIYDIDFDDNRLLISSFDYEDIEGTDTDPQFLFMDVDLMLTEWLSEEFVDNLIISHGLNKVSSKWEINLE